MNDIWIFIYAMGFAAVFGMTCVYMVMMMKSTLSEFDKPIKTKVPAPHPEMEGIKYGEELLVFNPEEEEDDDEDDGDIVVRT